MVILRMQATFGCLDGAVLELSDGLNCLVPSQRRGARAPGRPSSRPCSTAWIPPPARAGAGCRWRLQFAPWSGKPMAGIVHLKLEEREIVLERTSAARPMDTFRAYDPVTGQAVAGLTGDQLRTSTLGCVERAVFLRTAMIGGDLSVTADQALLQRLQNLASTGRRERQRPGRPPRRSKPGKTRCRYRNTRPPARDRGGHFLHQGGAQPRREPPLRRSDKGAASPGAGRGKREASPGRRWSARSPRRAPRRGAAQLRLREHDPPPGDASQAGHPGIALLPAAGRRCPRLAGGEASRGASPGGAAGAGDPPRAPAPLGASPGRRHPGCWRWRRRCWPPKSPCRRLEAAIAALCLLLWGAGRPGAMPEDPKGRARPS